eukprot:80263-Chlamydomonas_euryale.AAC.5
MDDGQAYGGKVDVGSSLASCSPTPASCSFRMLECTPRVEVLAMLNRLWLPAAVPESGPCKCGSYCGLLLAYYGLQYNSYDVAYCWLLLWLAVALIGWVAFWGGRRGLVVVAGLHTAGVVAYAVWVGAGLCKVAPAV